ncbi:reverse transcriptase domain-containing protein, partial [Tanacetum coccineum]
RSKAKAKKGRTKSRTRRFGHKETSSDFDYEEDLKETCEELSTPYKRPKPTPFTTKITRFKYHRRGKLPRNIKVYEGSKDPEDHLGIFSTAVEQEEWPMPIWYKMFRQTLSGAARNWFDDSDPESMDSFEELSHKFLEEFSQKKRYAKDPTEIHGIKRRLNKGLQAFMDRFKSESSRIKGVRPVLCISVRAFIRGEAATGSAKVARAPQWDKGNVCTRWFGGQERIKGRSGPREFRRSMGTYASYSRTETFTPLTKTPKEILGMEGHRDRGHNTNDCYNLKKQIEENVASGKLAHLAKDIRQGNQRSRGQGHRNVKVINMVGLGGNRKRPYEMEEPRVTKEITFSPIPWNSLTDASIILEGTIEGFRVRMIYVDGGSSSEIMYEHYFKSFGAYTKLNAPLVGFSGEIYHPLGLIDLWVTMGEPRMRSLDAVGSTIHSMIKFPIVNGVSTLKLAKKP